MEDKIIIYQTEDGQTQIDVCVENETVWLTQAQMVELFQTTKQNVSLHVSNVFKEGELEQEATVKEYLTVQKEGQRSVSRNDRIRQEQIGELRQLVQVVGRAITNQEVPDTVESQDLLNVVVDYSYALDTLDNYDYERLAENTLVALTLMIAESRTEEKDVMVKVVVNLINHKN